MVKFIFTNKEKVTYSLSETKIIQYNSFNKLRDKNSKKI